MTLLRNHYVVLTVSSRVNAFFDPGVYLVRRLSSRKHDDVILRARLQGVALDQAEVSEVIKGRCIKTVKKATELARRVDNKIYVNLKCLQTN